MAEPTQIIDPPVGPYSPPGELQVWLDELRQMERTPDVQEAINEAKEWLEDAIKRLQKSENCLTNQEMKGGLEHRALERQRWQETQEALGSANHARVIDGDSVHQWLQSWGTDDELPPPGP